MFTLLISRCQQLNSLKIRDWRKLQDRLNGYGVERLLFEFDFLAWHTRAVINTQRKVAELPFDKKDSFKQGILYRLETIIIETDHTTELDIWSLPFAK